jgi:RNA polymerase sigma factor (sigma-70 family)
MEESTDTQLIAACKQGDQRAWRSLVRRYERLVYSIALTMGLSQPDAADVAQSVFVDLVNGLDSITDDTAIAGWLGTVTRRKVWKTFKSDHVDGLARADSVASDEYARADDLEWVHQGLRQMSARCRELLIALYFTNEPMSYAEVSESLALPLGSIGPTRARCLEQLRTILQALNESD